MSVTRCPDSAMPMSWRQIPVRIGADDQIHPWHLLEQRGAQPLRHAADDAEHPAGALVPLELAHPADHPLLGVVADRAGVDQHDIGVRRLLGADVALTAEQAEHQLGVGHVHLAAVGLDVDALRHGEKIVGEVRREDAAA